MTEFADVVSTSEQVALTTSRSRKAAILAELLERLQACEIAICVGFLSGVPRQGRVGVGYAAIYGTEPHPAAEASLNIADVGRAGDELQAPPPRG